MHLYNLKVNGVLIIRQRNATFIFLVYAVTHIQIKLSYNKFESATSYKQLST